MDSPDPVTIPVRFTSEEHKLIEDLAEMRGVSTSDVVRELMGFAKADERVVPRLRLVSA